MDKESSLKAKKLAEEVQLLKNEIKYAIEAEENNKNAMDGLAMALQEVMNETKQAKLKLSLAKEEIETTKEEVEGLKLKLKIVEEQYDEAKKEVDKYKNFSDRLRLESEETLNAWIEKEKGFIECIKKVEEQRDVAEQENKMLVASLEQSKEETQKLRDVMEQAINEANVAKEAARRENFQLKDEISQKEQALSIISQEIESLRVKEVKEIEAPPPDMEDDHDDHHKEPTSNSKEILEMEDSHDQPQKEPNHKDHHHDKEHDDHRHEKEHHHNEKEPAKKSKHSRSNSSCLIMKFPYKHKQPQPHEEDQPKIAFRDSDEDSDSDYFDPLRGSNLDVDETAKSEDVPTNHAKKSSFSFTDGESTNSEEFHQLDSSNIDEETDKSLRKKKTFFSRFGDLIGVRSFYKKEQPPLEQ